MSGKINPSIPTSFAREMNFWYVWLYKIFVYVIKTNGISASLRIFFTIEKKSSILVPLFNDSVLAICIVGPSAIGSENGNPSSIMSVPPLINPLTAANVAFSDGYPAIIYEIKAASFFDFNWLNFSCILVIVLINIP